MKKGYIIGIVAIFGVISCGFLLIKGNITGNVVSEEDDEIKVLRMGLIPADDAAHSNQGIFIINKSRKKKSWRD